MARDKKNEFGLVSLAGGGIGSGSLLFLKAAFPLDPPELALTLVWLAIASGTIALVASVFALPRWKAYVGLILGSITLFLLLFGWPFYAVF